MVGIIQPFTGEALTTFDITELDSAWLPFTTHNISMTLKLYARPFSPCTLRVVVLKEKHIPCELIEVAWSEIKCHDTYRKPLWTIPVYGEFQLAPCASLLRLKFTGNSRHDL
jgi:hypothetical protein